VAWWTTQTPVFTPTGPPSVILTGDSPSAERDGGPDGSIIIGISIAGDTPAGQRSSGPDGVLAIEIVLTDSPTATRTTALDGVVGEGVEVGPDMPTGLRSSGPDGAVAIDLSITALPRGHRLFGLDGTVALGLTITGDTPAGQRHGGPVGVDFEDTNPSVTITDGPEASRYGGPTGSSAIDVPITGDVPEGIRFAGPDGTFAIDVILTDVADAGRYFGPDGALDILVGGTDTPGGYRSAGPDGSMGIVLPITGDSPGAGRYGGPVGILIVGVGADVIAGTATPSAGRYGGPDGEVLLAVLPTRQPYVSPDPLTIPSYSLWVADTLSGRMLWELPAVSHTWSNLLNDAGTIRATLAVESVWDALADQDERDPRVLLREVLTGPWRFSLVVRWGNNVVWAGPYISMNRTGPSSVDLNGAEIGKMLSKRIMVKPGAISPTDPTADLSFGPYTTKPHAAAGILNQMLTGVGNNLPLNVVDPGGSGLDARVYYGYDLADYWSKIQALSAEVDGPEVRFDPTINAGTDGDHLSWNVQIGNPHVGRNSTVWMFDSDESAIVGFTGDGSNMAFGVFAAGSGSARDKLISEAYNGQLLNIGWPNLESVDSTHSSETVYPVLASYANAALSAYSSPLVSFQVQVPADADPMVGTYRVGEDFTIDIRDDPLLPDGSYTRRIAGIAGTEKPWVTLTDANPLPVGST
jgi:hypothetical protein